MEHTSSTRRVEHKLVVGLAAALAVVFATAPQASGAPGEVSNARAQALDVKIAGQEVPSDVLSPAIAENSGAEDIATVLPLDLGPLEDLGVGLGDLPLLGDDGFLALGALNQVATAVADGASLAGAGAVSDAGAIDIPVDPVPAESGATLTIGTDDVGLGDVLELAVNLDAIASTAELPVGGEPSGTFDLSGLGIGLGGGVVDDIASQLDAAVAPVADQLTTLAGLLGAGDIAIENPLAEGALNVSEQNVLDAAGVGALNELPAGTDLLAYLPDAAAAALTGVVDDLVAQVQEAVDQLANSPQFATVCTPPLLPPNPACAVLDTAISTVQAALNTAVETIGETALATVGETVSSLLALPVGTEVVGDDGSFALTALTAIVGPGGELGELDLATSSVGPNTPAS